PTTRRWVTCKTMCWSNCDRKHACASSTARPSGNCPRAHSMRRSSISGSPTTRSQAKRSAAAHCTRPPANTSSRRKWRRTECCVRALQRYLQSAAGPLGKANLEAMQLGDAPHDRDPEAAAVLGCPGCPHEAFADLVADSVVKIWFTVMYCSSV